MNSVISSLIESELDKMQLFMSMDLIYIIPLNREIVDNFGVFSDNLVLKLISLGLVTVLKKGSKASITNSESFTEFDIIQIAKPFKIASNSYKAAKYFSFNKSEIFVYSKFQHMLLPEIYTLESKPHVKPTLD